MKKIRKFLIYGLFALCLIIPSVFLVNQKITKTSSAKSSNEFNFLEYVSISQDNKKITNENFIDIDSKKSLVANGNVSISIFPFSYPYTFNLESMENDFYITKKEVSLEKEKPVEGSNLNAQLLMYHLKYNSKDYYLTYYKTNGILKIYESKDILIHNPIFTSNNTNIITCELLPNENLKLTYLEKFTWKDSAKDFEFKFSINSTFSTNYSFNLLKTKVEFANQLNPIMNFKAFDKENSSIFNESFIEKEQRFSKMTIDFLQQQNLGENVYTYTETNPLFFDINYNGFTYSFKLYSKQYNGKNLLFVNYYDNNSEEKKLDYLATSLLPTGEIFQEIEDLKQFSLTFTKTGRYEIEVYDSSYICNSNNPNYYKTSFYIVDPNESIFNNIYMIAQIFDEKNKPIEYIVANTTLNNNVKVTIKNLTNLENNEKLSNIIENIQVIKTIFGSSDVIGKVTTYSIEDILNNLDEDGNFHIDFSDDAYYEVVINPKAEIAKTLDNSNKRKTFAFTLIKKPKTSMVVEGEEKEATIPYYTEIKDYHLKINSEMKITKSFTGSTPIEETLKKTYINNFIIKYAMQQTEMTRGPAESINSEGKKVVNKNAMTIKFKGVGDIKVTVTFNGKNTEYDLNSEKGKDSITLSEFGQYEIKMVDSMGSETIKIFTLKKSLNTSAIVLIALSSFLALSLILFIVINRSSIKTR